MHCVTTIYLRRCGIDDHIVNITGGCIKAVHAAASPRHHQDVSGVHGGHWTSNLQQQLVHMLRLIGCDG